MHTIPGYEWDPKKAAANLHKHGVDFADAATAFSDESALKVADHISSVDEDRFVILWNERTRRCSCRGLRVARRAYSHHLGPQSQSA